MEKKVESTVLYQDLYMFISLLCNVPSMHITCCALVEGAEMANMSRELGLWRGFEFAAS